MKEMLAYFVFMLILELISRKVTDEKTKKVIKDAQESTDPEDALKKIYNDPDVSMVVVKATADFAQQFGLDILNFIKKGK